MPSDKQTVSVRLPEDLLAFVDRIAAEQERSRNWVIVDLVRKAKDTPAPQPDYETNSDHIIVNRRAGVLAIATAGWLPAYVRVTGDETVTLSTPDDEGAYAILPEDTLTINMPARPAIPPIEPAVVWQ